MKLYNIGTKIVNVGAKVLMPGSDMPITKIQAETPAIKVLVKHGFLKLEEDGKAEFVEPNIEEVKAEAKVEDKVEAPVEETKEEAKAEEPQKEVKKAAKKVTAE